MTILPVSNFINNNLKPLAFKGATNSVASQSDKHVTTKDIPYYPIAFKGQGDMQQRLEDSRWAKGVFEYYGMEPEIDPKDGLLIISEFRNPVENHRYEDFGIDVERLVKNVKKIKGEGDFIGHQYKNLCVPNLEEVGDALWCREAENMKFPKLKSVKNFISCWLARSIDLSALEDVRSINCDGAKSIKLPEKIIKEHNIPRSCIAA